MRGWRYGILLLLALSGLSCHGPSSDTDQASVALEDSATREAMAKPAATDPPSGSIAAVIPTPAGYARIGTQPGAFGTWLRNLPLKPGRPEVLLYNGRKKGNQSAHTAVVDLDIGTRDLQQCADAVIRLRAEYLFARPCKEDIAFHFTSGDMARWTNWRDGMRPRVVGSHVSWIRLAVPDDSYTNFRAYLDTVFTYAGSASLERELEPVENPGHPEIGDAFVQGGFPGHAVIIVDVAENQEGDRVFLLAQSYMPAQDIQILRSFEDIDPWYRARSSGELQTPEWEFRYENLRRFLGCQCEVEGLQSEE